MAIDDINAKIPLLQKALTNETAVKSKEENSSLSRRRIRRAKSTPASRYDPSPLNSPNSNLPHQLSNTSTKPTFLLVSLVLALYLTIGTICFVIIRGDLQGKKTNAIVDALYFCIVTMTTVGYGDLVPATTLAKMLSCLFVFSGMAIVGLVLSQAADYFVEKHEAIMAKAFHLRDKATSADIHADVEANKTKYKFMTALALLIGLMGMGTLFLVFNEGMTLIDAFYCVCSTMTTLGYGDQSFGTEGGRIFAVLWILSGTICLAQFFYYLTELYTERRQKSVWKLVLGRELTFEDIEAADIDNDKSVSAAEFIVYKLKEMGRISSHDITILMESFRRLDVDDSGTLTIHDIINAA